jgi:hypothetical protein
MRNEDTSDKGYFGCIVCEETGCCESTSGPEKQPKSAGTAACS